MKHLFTVTFLLSAIAANSQTTIFQENFDSGIPNSFILYNNDGYTPHADVSEYNNAWISKIDPEDATNTVASSTSYFDSPGMANRWLITPSISLSAFGNALSWSGRSHDASYAESYLVLLSTTGTAVENFTDTLVAVVNEDIYWTNHTVNLSEEGFNAQDVHIAFVLRTVDGFKFYMDSLKITGEDPVGLGKIEEKTFKLFPNPATDNIAIEADFQVQLVRIRDLNGAVVIETNASQIDVQKLSGGIYLIELVHASGVTSKKFIKK